jgi:hypothetical protein
VITSVPAGRYQDAGSLQLGVQTILDDLVLDPNRVPEFEEALAELGRHLGFDAQRPERDTGNGPDVLWSLGGLRYLVIEAKSGATADRIWRKDVEQVSHSMNWFHEKYDSTCSATPVLVHRINQLEANATAPARLAHCPMPVNRSWPAAVRPHNATATRLASG